METHCSDWCVLERYRRAVLRKTGAVSSSNATIIIPMSVRGYQKPQEWRKYRSGWTLQPGDYICRGQINIPIAHSAAKELSGFDDVRSIVSADCKLFGSGMDHLGGDGEVKIIVVSNIKGEKLPPGAWPYTERSGTENAGERMLPAHAEIYAVSKRHSGTQPAERGAGGRYPLRTTPYGTSISISASSCLPERLLLARFGKQSSLTGSRCITRCAYARLPLGRPHVGRRPAENPRRDRKKLGGKAV